MTITALPTKPDEPDISMTGFRWLIYGDPKSGKTSLAAQFPNHFIIQADDGCKGMRVSGLRVKSWDDICDVVDLLVNRKDHGYDSRVACGLLS